MQIFHLTLAAMTLFLLVLIALDVYFGSRKIEFLRDVALPQNVPHPLVSIIIPACNEERNIEEALLTILNQDYPNLEIIVVNDRSSDQTGMILERLAQQHLSFRLIEITQLPEGWLGKNHALYTAAKQARGDLLLFTDADVMMKPDTVSLAVHYLIDRQLDHLAATPEPAVKGTLLQMFVGTFVLFFMIFTRPWRAPRPQSKRHIGIGSFNLVCRCAYEKAGTHQAIAMRPDDDMKLGKLLKTHGFLQELLYGTGKIKVEWYSSLRQMIDGLMKNTTAGFDYRMSLVWLAIILMFALWVWPWLSVPIAGGIPRVLNLIGMGVAVALYAGYAGVHGARRWHAVALPLTSMIFIYILIRANVLTWYKKGITWRGSFYSLAELKKNKV